MSALVLPSPLLASPRDIEAIRQLLALCELPNVDVEPHLQDFIVQKDGEELVGVVGLEIEGGVALLRSLAVSPKRRNQGIGNSLCSAILEYARKREVRSVYLLTLTAEPFFERLGFVPIDRVDAPPSIQGSREFQELCPDTATLLHKGVR